MNLGDFSAWGDLPGSGASGDEGSRHELIALRRSHETLEWLIGNAPPKAWAQGVGVLQADLEDPGGKASHYRFANLVCRVQQAMPQREATAAEESELRALIAQFGDEESRGDLLALAMTNPAWYLRSIRGFVTGRDAEEKEFPI